ncbi:DUF885 family protein [Actinoplanes sp. NPDC051343]|uniref:DUF885 family protein n=1 Tax=Actinoplanes sp. NPDC051343 TaxID=3363906 RepID=UPI0037A79AEF
MTGLLDDLVARELRRTPVTAARLGASTPDAALPDMSEKGIGRSAAEDREWIERLNAFEPATADERFDRDLAVSGLQHRLVLDDLGMHRRSPELYTTPVLAALRLGVHQQDYLDQAPDLLRHGRRNLDPSLTDPQLLVRAAAQAKAGSAACERLGGSAAARAYAEFAVFLGDLAVSAHGDPAIGEASYTALVQVAAGDGYDAASVHELGTTRVREIRERLSTLPVFTDQPARDGDQLLQWYREETARAQRFCADHDVITLPGDEECEVAATPADKLALLPVASYEPPPLLSGAGTGRFLVPPAPQRRSGLATVTVHETYPGHHAHYSRMSRRPLRVLFTTPFFTEGWGVYAEQLAGELGYYTGPGELRGHLVALLVRAARAAIDAGLHTGAMTPGDARTFLSGELNLPGRYADAEVNRALAYPSQAAAYLIGATEIAAIVAAAGGPSAQVHDRLTALGSPPLPLARAVL